MSESRIRLTPPPEAALPVQAAPREGLARWLSSYETEGHPGGPGIFVTQAAYRTIDQHVVRTLTLEVGGMLVGHAYRSPAGSAYVVIEEALPARHVLHSRVHLTFTSDTLADMLARVDESAPDKQIVGWYHTHPGLSIFLSSMDLWLHTHFFPQPWHVALVIDPQAGHGGFFSYAENGQLDPQAYAGFYELGAPGASSIVTWRNLAPREPDFAGTLWAAVETEKDGLP